MPPDAALDTVRAVYAPTQVYIVLAITLTTFAWLLKPDESLGRLTGGQAAIGATLILLEIVHIAAYPVLRPSLNSTLHIAALALYWLAAAWLFSDRWAEAKSRPPNSPG